MYLLWLFSNRFLLKQTSNKQVYFLGKAEVSKVRGNPHLARTNYGYDDERGDYHIVNHDHIAYR